MPKSGEHKVISPDSFFKQRPSKNTLKDGEPVSFLEDGKLIKQEKRNGVVYQQEFVEAIPKLSRETDETGVIREVIAGAGLTGGGFVGEITLDVVGGTGITANANDIAIDSTVATLTGSQTLSNKTLAGPIVTGNLVADSIDVAGDLTLDADGADIILKDGGTEYGRLSQLLGGLTLKSGSSEAVAVIFSTDGDAIFAQDLAISAGKTFTFDSVALTTVQTSSESFADNDTSLMTSAAINDKIGTEVASLVDSAPSTLDTLNELAAALGDDANFSTTVTNSIATKASLTGTETLTNKTLASPTFTGDIDFSDASSPILTITDTTNTAQLRLFATDTTTDIGSLSAHKVNFRYNNDIRLQLEDTKFMVNAGSDDMDFTVKDASGLQALHVDAGDGDVNIRTLDVSGDADIDGTLETDALTIGGVTSVPFEAADHSKLDGIEALADVTDTANVTSAGALMDSEVTDLDGIKSLTVPNSTTISAFAKTYLDDADTTIFQNTIFGTTDVALGGQQKPRVVTLDYKTDSVTAIGSGDNFIIIDASDNYNLKVATFPTVVGTTGAINANEFARFTNSTTLEARTASEVLSDIGAQASDAVLDDISAIDTSVLGLNDTDKFIAFSGSSASFVLSSFPATQMSGSTNNGLLTYNSASVASVESGLTYGSSLLTVSNQIKVLNSSTDVRLNANFGGKAAVGTVGSHDFNFITANTIRATVDSGGNFGIGTESPATKLHLMSGDLFLTANSTSADSGQGIFWQSTTSGWNTGQALGAIYGRRVDASNGYLRFDTRSSGTTAERMRIDQSGNLGIGTNSPSNKLEAYGTDAGLVVHYQGNSRGGIHALSTQRIALSTTASADDLVFGYGSSPVTSANFVERMKIDNGTGAITFNNAYTFPTSDGSTGQFLKTNGSGNVLFSDGDIAYTDLGTASLGLNDNNKTLIFSSSSASWGVDFPASTLFTANTNVNNRILTATGATNGVAVNGESNLTFDGDFKVAGTLSSLETINFDQSSGDTVVKISGTGSQRLEFADTATGANAWIGIPSWNDDAFYLFGPTASGNEHAYTYESSTHRFYTAGNEQLAIFSNGAIGMSAYSSADRHLEIGSSRQANGYAYIDLIGDTTYTDFGARFIRENGGANTGTAIEHRGTGVLSLNAKDAGSVRFHTSNTERVRIDSSGNVLIASGNQLNFNNSSNANYGRISADSEGLNLDTVANRHTIFKKQSVEVMRIDTSGNLGIGTAHPASPLEVNGNVAFGNTATGIKGTIHSTDEYRINALDVDENGYNSLHLRADGTDGLFIQKDTNKVGIGTTSPAQPLQVTKNNATSIITIHRDGSNPSTNTTLQQINFDQDYDSSQQTWGKILYKTTDASSVRGRLAFEVKSTSGTLMEGMTVYGSTSSGPMVGIGTTAPLSKLHIEETTNDADALMIRQVAGGSGSVQGKVHIGMNHFNSTNPSVRITAEEYDVADYRGNLAFSTRAGTSDVAPTEKMRITHDGNVGIGQTSPQAKLEVKTAIDSINTILSAPLATIGNLTAYLNYQDLEFRNNYVNTTGTAKVRLRHHSNLYVNSGSQFSIATSTTGGTITEALRVDNAQNVGIGQASPTRPLHIGTATTNGEAIRLDGHASYGATISYSRGGSYNWNAGVGGSSSASSNIPSSFWGVEDVSQSNAVRLSIAHTTGYVGIGTTSPSTPLHVAGLVRITESGETAFYGGNYVRMFGTQSFTFRNSGGSIISQIGLNGDSYFNGGNVGIGTGSPASKMHIQEATAGTPASTFQSALKGGLILEDDNSTTANNILIKSHSLGNDEAIGGIKFVSSPDGSNYSWAGIQGLVSTFAAAGQLAFYTAASNTAGATSTERMRINSSGNVGIGATAPLRKLHVAGDFAVNGATDQYYGIYMNGGESNDPRILIGDWHNSSGSIMWDSSENVLKIDSQHSTANRDIVFTGNDFATEYMRVNATGLGIGTTSPGRPLVVNGSSATFLSIVSGQNDDGGILFGDSSQDYDGQIRYNNASHFMFFKTNNAERMRIDSSGNVLIGGTSASGHGFNLEVLNDHAYVKGPDGWDGNGDKAIVALGSGVSNESFGCGYVYGTGLVLSTYKPSGGGHFGSSTQNSLIIADTTGEASFINDVVAFASSDKRLKENVKPLDNALDKINKINGVEFDWIDGKDKHGNSVHSNEGHDVGVIAQEIEEVLPEVVTTRDNGYKAVKYEKIVPLLIEAIKEQQQQINKLEEKLNG